MPLNSLGDWPELEKVIKEGRCEVVLHGNNKTESHQCELDEKVQSGLFHKDSPLNFIEFVSMKLRELSPTISNARHLTNLVLRSNLLNELPEEIGQLENLKLLDCANNALSALPKSMMNLKNLMTINLSNNKLSNEGLFDFTNLENLQHLDLSHNALEFLPDSLFRQNNSKLQEFIVDQNRISSVPSCISSLARVLKTFSIASNVLKDLPYPLKDFQKLRVLNLKENPFSDKRFAKLISDPRQTSSAILDYLKKKAPKSETSNEFDRAMVDDQSNPDLAKLIVRIGVSPGVKRSEDIAKIRPHIVCCILRNLDLTGENMKKLISLHNKLHDSICNYRTSASIGFHDISKFEFPLNFLALEPENLKIMPLGKSSVITAKTLIGDLTTEAEALRKKQKKNTYSSIHKYLHLVKNLELYPCLVDANGLVLSFAPVTNSENTKITPESKDIFVEVTSQDKMPLCREIMNKLIQEIISTHGGTDIVVEQVKVVHENGNLVSAFPDKNDLALENLNVQRIVDV